MPTYACTHYPFFKVTVPLQLLVTAILNMMKLLLVTKTVTSYVAEPLLRLIF